MNNVNINSITNNNTNKTTDNITSVSQLEQAGINTDVTKANIITKDEKTQGIKTDLSINILLLTDTKEYIKGAVEGWKAGANLNTIMNNFVVGQALESAMNHNEDVLNGKIDDELVTPEQMDAILNFNMFKGGKALNGAVGKPDTSAHVVVLNATAGHNNIGTAVENLPAGQPAPSEIFSDKEGSIIVSKAPNELPVFQNMSVFHDITANGIKEGPLQTTLTIGTILPALLLTGTGLILDKVNPIGGNGINSNPNINNPSDRSVLIQK